MHVARGAQPELPAVSSATLCRPSVSVVQVFPARGVEILRRKRSSINCLASKVRGLRVLSPILGVAPLGNLSLCRNGGAVQRPLVHCAAATAAASSTGRCARLSPTLCSKESDLVLVGALRSGEGFHHDQSQGASAVQISRVPVGWLRRSRLTNRCSGPGPIKCLAAGGQALSFCGRWRARVLQRPWAAAELNR